MAVTMHPITLQYSDNELEMALCGSRRQQRLRLVLFTVGSMLLLGLTYVDLLATGVPVVRTPLLIGISVVGLSLFIVMCVAAMSHGLHAHRIFDIGLCVGSMLAFVFVFLAPRECAAPNTAAADRGRGVPGLSFLWSRAVQQDQLQPVDLGDVAQVVGRGLVLQVVAVSVHLLHARLVTKVAVGVFTPVAHTLHPIWRIGWLEAALYWLAAVSGVLIGYTIERCHRHCHLQSSCAQRVQLAHEESERGHEGQHEELFKARREGATRVENGLILQRSANSSMQCDKQQCDMQQGDMQQGDMQQGDMQRALSDVREAIKMHAPSLLKSPHDLANSLDHLAALINSSILNSSIHRRQEPTTPSQPSSPPPSQLEATTLGDSSNHAACALQLRPDILIASLDTSSLMRTMDRTHFALMGIDDASVRHVRGATNDEVLGFVEYVMHMQPRPADICILPSEVCIREQRLERDSLQGDRRENGRPSSKSPTLKGMQLAAQLRDRGYPGKLVMKSARCTPEDVKTYEDVGIAVLPKGLDARDLNCALACIMLNLSKPPDLEPAYDFERLESFDQAFLQGCIKELSEEMTKHMTELEAQVEAQAFVAADGVLHQIKGLTANFGGLRIAGVCEGMRKQGATGMGTQEWNEGLCKVRDALWAFIELLQQVDASEDEAQS